MENIMQAFGFEGNNVRALDENLKNNKTKQTVLLEELADMINSQEEFSRIVLCGNEKAKTEVMKLLIYKNPSSIYSWIGYCSLTEDIKLAWKMAALCECIIADNSDLYDVKSLFAILNAVKMNFIMDRTNDINKEKNHYLYILKNNDTMLYKIGITSNPFIRHRSISSHESSLENIALFQCSDGLSCRNAERKLHGLYKQKRSVGEWFSLSQDDIKSIKSVASEMKMNQINISFFSEQRVIK